MLLSTDLIVGLKGVGAAAAFDSSVTFAGKLGTADRLEPKDLSEPVSVTFTVMADSGWDAAFDFRVTGGVPKGR